MFKLFLALGMGCFVVGTGVGHVVVTRRHNKRMEAGRKELHQREELIREMAESHSLAEQQLKALQCQDAQLDWQKAGLEAEIKRLKRNG